MTKQTIAERKRRIKIGRKLAQRLPTFATLEETAEAFGVSREQIRIEEGMAFYKIVTRLSKALGYEIKL